jgi:hypothetical protein
LVKCKYSCLNLILYYIYNARYVKSFLVPCRITNLKFWGRSEQIITKTLQLLNDLSVGYSSVRKLVKLDAVQFMLNNHTVSALWVIIL